MKKSNLRLIGIIVFLFVFVSPAFSKFLYADVLVKDLSFDADAEKVVWKEVNGRLEIQSTGKLKLGEVLPDTCRICVVNGEVTLEKESQQIVVTSGEFFESTEAKVLKAQVTSVEVAEGKVVYQDELVQDGLRKPLGNPILVKEGQVLLRVNNCHNFYLGPSKKFDNSAGSADSLVAPLQEYSDEGPVVHLNCASPPC